MAGNTGRFVWYELMTSDPKGAIAFYTEVIGWKTQPWETGEYTMWMGSQGPLGGVMKLPPEAAKMGAPPHWTSNVLVADVDATAALAKKLGGKVHKEPEDIPKVGRFAVISDPQGAFINVFKSSQEMAPHDSSRAGEFTWNELMTTDHEAALRFYGQLFKWETVREHDMGPMGKYVLFGLGGKELGGMMNKPKDVPMPPAWTYYVATTELDTVLARAKSKNAKVLNGPMEVPGGGRIVQLKDPQGAVVALFAGPEIKK
jgi:uncharacterized protein